MRTGLLVVAVLLAAACGNGTYGAEGNNTVAQHGGDLKVGLEYDPSTLDPLYATQRDELQVLRQVFDSLLEPAAGGGVRPGLATAWFSPGPTTLVLSLRPGVRFQDGRPLDAAAVRDSLRRELAASDSPRRADLAAVRSVTAAGPLRVVLHLARADPNLLTALAGPAGMVVSPAAVADQGPRFASNPVGAGTGPFAFQFWRRGYHVILKRNAGYWGPEPYLNQLDFSQASPGPGLDRLEASDLDVLETVDPADLGRARSDPDLALLSSPAPLRPELVLNEAPGTVFADPGHRQALSISTAAGPAFGFDLKVDTEPRHLAEALQLQSRMGRAGVKVRVQPEDADVLAKELRAGQFDAALVEGGAGAAPYAGTEVIPLGGPGAFSALGRWVHGVAFASDGTFELTGAWIG